MGKMTKRRPRHGRPNPTGVVSERDAADGDSSIVDRVGGTVNKLVEKLQSGHAEERECACMMIAGMIGQPGASLQFMSGGAIRVLGPLLLDDKASIQLSAIGALRNLSTEGNTLCEAMVRQDVMTSVVALLRKLNPGMEGAVDDSCRSLLLQGIHLLWNLCESSAVAVEIFTSEGLIHCLLPCMDATSYGVEIAVSAAQCLYTVSEDNAALADHVTRDGGHMTGCLHKVVEHAATQNEYSYVLLAVLTTGLLHNLSTSPGASGMPLAAVLAVMSHALDMDTSKLLTEVQQVAAARDTPAGENGVDTMVAESADHQGQPVTLGVDSEVKDSELEKAVCSVCEALTAQQVALEIIANACCCGEGGDEEWDDVSSNESIGDADSTDVTDTEVAMDAQVVEPMLPSEIHTLLVSHNILQKVLSKIEPPNEELTTSLRGSYGQRALTQVAGVCDRGLFCLGNLVSSLPADALGGPDNLHTVWTGLGTLVAKFAGEGNPELLEASTSALRAVTHKLAEANPAAFASSSSGDLQFLVTMGTQGHSADVRVNVIRIMAAIGQQVAKQQPPPAIVKDIGVYLLCTVQREPELWVQAEALDGLFDVFSEDHLDAITQDIGLLPRLRQLVPTLKVRMNTERHQLGEHLPVVMTTRTNLMRFIKYKSKSVKK